MIGPIIIGGIGGSGTRVVASILQTLDVFIGDDMNIPLDNITYTFLFKRPRWFYKNKLRSEKIETGIRIMEKSMTNTKPYSIRELIYLVQATKSMALFGHNIQKHGTGWWAFKRLNHIIFKRQKSINHYVGWGWKEANSHLILPSLDQYFSSIKYIHTLRHGLDLAYSKTQQQLFNWAPLYGINIPKNDKEIPAMAFRYWVEVNRRVLREGKKMGPDRFYMLNFDNLCEEPEREIKKLISFLKIDIDEKKLLKAIRIPIKPNSVGRYKKYKLPGLANSDLEFLNSLGFEYS